MPISKELKELDKHMVSITSMFQENKKPRRAAVNENNAKIKQFDLNPVLQTSRNIGQEK